MEEILVVNNLNKSFRISKKQQRLKNTKQKINHAVNNLSFSANKGEIFGLLGPNGAGKTTTLRMLATLIKPDSGHISINGINALENHEEVRQKIGFLTSELKMEEFFTPNYLFDFFSKLHKIDSLIANKRKKLLFNKFGIDEFAEIKIANLSTGMKQKASLVISLAHDPEVIIFDEPTNGLDIITSKVVTDFLIEQRNEGKTIIVSTHIFSLVEKLCDRVGIILNGKMAVCDKLEHITKDCTLEDKFFEIYKERGFYNEE